MGGTLAPFLEGTIVVDLGHSPVTAMAARMLADLGADVRVGSERGKGDSADLRAADVVLSAAPPGTTTDQLAARRDAAPHAIWVRVSPFGSAGPRSAWVASDLGVMAASGNLWATGDPDRPPVRCAGDASYAHSAPEVVVAVTTALASGVRPLDVDVSMQEIVAIANMGAIGRYARSHARGQRLGANIGRTREIWPCADGWVSFGLRGGKARIPSLQTISRLVGDPALTERDWSTFDHTKASDDELRTLEDAVGSWFRTKTMVELYAIACETNLMLAPVNTPRELYASAQLDARNFFDDDREPRRWCHPQPSEEVLPAAPRRGSESAEPARDGAWAGLRLLEFGAGAAGPIATRYFAEHGATVLRVESASRPDFLRTGSYADMFDALNCGKRSVSLNLKHPDGHALAQRLVVEWADAVEENFAPRAMKGLGLSYGDLAPLRPDLVMVSACLNGQTGPHRDYPGFGGQGSALAGFNHLTGWPDREPIGPFGTITDSLAPRFVAAALGAALLYRRRTGRGSYVDISQVECATWTLRDWLLAYARDGVIGNRRGNDHPAALHHGVHPCAGEDRWVAVACWTPEQLAGLEAVIGSKDEAAIESWTAARTALECAEALQAAGVEAVPVQDFGDVHDDPQLAARGHLVSLSHPDLGPGVYERNGFRICSPGAAGSPGDELPAGYRRAGPTLGQDNEWVLGDLLGLSPAEQARLRDAGALS